MLYGKFSDLRCTAARGCFIRWLPVLVGREDTSEKVITIGIIAHANQAVPSNLTITC